MSNDSVGLPNAILYNDAFAFCLLSFGFRLLPFIFWFSPFAFYFMLWGWGPFLPILAQLSDSGLRAIAINPVPIGSEVSVSSPCSAMPTPVKMVFTTGWVGCMST